MKITLEDLKDALGVETLGFYKSTKSNRKVCYSPPTHKISFVVMTKEDEEFDPTKPVYAVILNSKEFKDYNFAAVITNKAPAETVFEI